MNATFRFFFVPCIADCIYHCMTIIFNNKKNSKADLKIDYHHEAIE